MYSNLPMSWPKNKELFKTGLYKLMDMALLLCYYLICDWSTNKEGLMMLC